MKCTVLSLLVFVFTFAVSAWADVDILPGLWELKNEVEMNGQKFDPQETLKTALDSIPAEYRAQAEAAMKKMGKGVDLSKPIQSCITKEMLKNEKIFPDQGGDCTYDYKTKTSKKIAAHVVCKNGMKGDMEWTVVNKTTVNGKMDGINADGAKMKIQSIGKFLKADCGNTKTGF